MGVGHKLLGLGPCSNGRLGRAAGTQRSKATTTVGPGNYTEQCNCCNFSNMESERDHCVLRLCRTNEVAVVPRREKSD